mgnify:CR=1 FL=1
MSGIDRTVKVCILKDNMKVQKTEEEWKRQLSPQQFEILRNKGTEPAFTGQYVDMHDDGIFLCIACGSPLFSSETKFESGSGWPSFYDVASKGNVILKDDNSNGLDRTEVVCSNCSGHLGHMFTDLPRGKAGGPKEKTGLRYCINSCALNFKKK